jgi:hypothetical protein
MKFWSAALIALPLLGVALVYGWKLSRCHHTESASATAADSEKSECCSSDKSQSCPPEGKADALEQTRIQGSDPDKQMVFQVEGLRCPAVNGIGCGHMLHPVLASLDKIDGVEASSTNYTGTMIRVSVTRAKDRAKVAEEIRKVLAENKAVVLAGDDLKRALEKEQWRETWRVGELSAIEFHTLAVHRVKTFAKAEKLDKGVTDKLVEIAEQQWQRLSKEAKNDGATKPEDWGRRIRAALPSFLEQSKGVLTAEQVERFKQRLTAQCCDDDCPEAPPAPPSVEKVP